jgi:hypothetical protein
LVIAKLLMACSNAAGSDISPTGRRRVGSIADYTPGDGRDPGLTGLQLLMAHTHPAQPETEDHKGE